MGLLGGVGLKALNAYGVPEETKYCQMSVTRRPRVSGIRAELAGQERGVVRKSSGGCSLLRVVHGIPGGASVLGPAVAL